MIRLSFTEEDMKELDYQRYHHPHPRVQKKMEVAGQTHLNKNVLM